MAVAAGGVAVEDVRQDGDDAERVRLDAVRRHDVGVEQLHHLGRVDVLDDARRRPADDVAGRAPAVVVLGRRLPARREVLDRRVALHAVLARPGPPTPPPSII